MNIKSNYFFFVFLTSLERKEKGRGSPEEKGFSLKGDFSSAFERGKPSLILCIVLDSD